MRSQIFVGFVAEGPTDVCFLTDIIQRTYQKFKEAVREVFKKLKRSLKN